MKLYFSLFPLLNCDSCVGKTRRQKTINVIGVGLLSIHFLVFFFSSIFEIFDAEKGTGSILMVTIFRPKQHLIHIFLKMTGETLEVRYGKRFNLIKIWHLTFDIWHFIFVHLTFNQWINEPMDQWTNGHSTFDILLWLLWHQLHWCCLSDLEWHL